MTTNIVINTRTARAAEIFYTDTLERVFRIVRDEGFPGPEILRSIVFTLTNHIGESEAISLALLSNINEVNERTMRKLLEILVVRYGVPVGSHSHKAGRWIIETEKERERVLKDLYSRRNAIDARINVIATAKLPPTQDGLQDLQPVQPVLPFTETE